MRFLTFFNHQQKRIPADWRGLLFVYIPMHEVAPSAGSALTLLRVNSESWKVLTNIRFESRDKMSKVYLHASTTCKHA